MEYVKAFIVGGVLCAIAQILIDKTKLTTGRILVGYVVGGVVLEGFGLFKYIRDFAGCGATVPLVGFGAALAEGTRQMIMEKGFIGILTGPLTSCSAGIMVAILLAVLMSVISKPKGK